jgi:hypothetical protein
VRVLLVLAVLGLGASAWFAPAHYRARPGVPGHETLFQRDPAKRVADGEAVGSLGLAFSGYEELFGKDPSNPVVVRGLFRTGQLLGASAFGQPHLDRLVGEVTQAYLARRAEIDPDGSFMRGVAGEWIDVRRQHPFWLAQASVAIFSTAAGDPVGKQALLALPEKAFFLEFFPFALRFLPGWPAVEAVARRDLADGRLLPRVLAGMTVLFYHHVYGVGGDLLEKYGPAIRSAFLEAKAGMGPPPKGPDHYGHCLFGLAMLGEPEDLAVLRGMRLLDYPRFVDAIRVARLAAGIDPFSGHDWKALEDMSELVYRAAAFRYARLVRESGADASIQDARAVLERGLYDSNDLVRVLCFRVLAAVDPQSAGALVEQKAAERGLTPLFAAFHLEPERRVPLLVPFLAVQDPGIAAIAAVGLRDPHAPPPIQLAPR